MSNLLSQGGFGCVYYPGIKCNGKTNTNKSIITKLQKNDFNASNEINIGKILMNNDKYYIYCSPIITSCPINIRNITNSKNISDCDIVTENDNFNYIIMDMTYIPNKLFYDFFLSNINKQFIFSSINSSYIYLLNSLEFLNSQNVVHFDLKGDNILYNLTTNNPLIIDFGISIPITHLNKKNFNKYFYTYAPEYYTWCLDIHVINYLIYETNLSLTDYDIKDISRKFVDNNKGLSLFSSEFKELYYNDCYNELKQYINISSDIVIKKLLSFHKTWDNYSLSIIYLKLLDYIYNKGFSNNSILILFSQILLFNISPNPNKRLTLENSRIKFNSIFQNTTNNLQSYYSLITNINFDNEESIRTMKKELQILNNIQNIS